MKINEEFLHLILNSYHALKESGKEEGFLNETRLGGLKIFINHKPAMVMLHIPMEVDDVYIGTND